MRLMTSLPLRPLPWIAAAVLALAGCATAPPPATPVSRLDAVQKAGVLRICTPGDYKPFSFQKPDAGYEGIDVDLMTGFAASLNARPEWVKTSWANLMPDLTAGKCDMAVGGISVTTDRQKLAFFSSAYMVNGKTPIARCADVAKYQTVAQIDKPAVRVIFNPGGSNERFARANFKQAKLTLPGLCAVNPDKPLQYGEMAWLLPRDDVAFKSYVDQWLHLSQAGGEFQRVMDRWLK
jgi:cyclohexadienyl dehydratase